MKDDCTNREKNDPPPSPLVRRPCEHTINFEKSGVFLHHKVRTSASEEPPPVSPLVHKMFALDKPPFLLSHGRRQRGAGGHVGPSPWKR